MKKLPLAAAVAVSLIAGCSHDKTYQYTPNGHSGTVHVTEQVFTSLQKKCVSPIHRDVDWRQAPHYQPKGLPKSFEQLMDVDIQIHSTEDGQEQFNLQIPQSLDASKVVARDFMKSESFMLQPTQGDMVQHGEYFYYPKGYYIRVAQPELEGNTVSACVSVDHMYVLKTDMDASDNPPIYLDRMVTPYRADVGEAVKVSFGTKQQHHLTIKIKP